MIRQRLSVSRRCEMAILIAVYLAMVLWLLICDRLGLVADDNP